MKWEHFRFEHRSIKLHLHDLRMAPVSTTIMPQPSADEFCHEANQGGGVI